MMAKSSSKEKPKKSRLSTSRTGFNKISNNENKDDDVLLPPGFPQHLPRPPKGDFLIDESPYKASFEEAIRGPYEGFVVDEGEALKVSSKNSPEPVSIEEKRIQSSLISMAQYGLFRTDVTQPFGLGTKCAKTYVTRCLLGEPGTTYKYLGLRMFAHPWRNAANQVASSSHIPTIRNSNNDSKISLTDLSGGKNTPGQDMVEGTVTIRELSQTLTKRTEMHLLELDDNRRRRKALSTKGRPDFDICLINRMESSSELKPFTFGGGNIIDGDKNRNDSDRAGTAVSWHADSSLEHYSTIAVYQTLLGGSEIQEKRKSKDKTKRKKITQAVKDGAKGQWWIALRVAHHSEGPQASQKRRWTNTEASIVEDTPPIAVSLPSGSAYYLLDDFNHHHQHTVFTTGNTATAGVRYSCTFRLLRDSHNVMDWINRGKAAIRQFHKKGPKIWRSEQLLLTEIESEWIRQFFIQGTGNQKLLWESYWKAPIEELLSIWSQLECRTKQTMDLLRAAAEEKCGMESIRNSENNRSKFVEIRPSKAERKARDRRKKSLEKIEELISRVCSNNGNMSKTQNIHKGGEIACNELYQPFAELLEERAEMRELWGKREKDHIFHEMAPDCRPIQVPFKYEGHQTSDDLNNPDGRCLGISPLPGSPVKLKEMSRQIMQCGQAFREGKTSLLPPPWRKNTPEPDHHKKPMDWPGWGAIDQIFGLELQHPWAGAIVDGKKSIETRSYTIPPSLIGKKVMIIESSSGQTGISNLGNRIGLSRVEEDGDANLIGWCIFSSVKVYETEHDFRAEENLHLVTQESGYGWKEGVTKKIYGWIVEERYRCNDFSPGSTGYGYGIRRFRSLFQLCAGVETSNPKKKKSKRKRFDRKENKKGQKKKRKRY